MEDLITPTNRIAFSFLLLLILFAWESLFPFFAAFNQSKTERGKHALVNLSLGFVNGALNASLCVTLWLGVAVWTAENQFGFLNAIPNPPILHLFGALLILDAWMYGWHRLNHRIPFLWRFHRVHHSDPTMDVTTASRFHFGEILMSCIVRLPLIALAGISLEELAIYEALAFFFAQVQHANISLSPRIDGWLRILFVTPFMHKVHHSQWQPETDSNYSVLFSWWDRLSGTLRLRQEPHSLHFGLSGREVRTAQTLKHLLVSPLVNRNTPSAHLGSASDD